MEGVIRGFDVVIPVLRMVFAGVVLAMVVVSALAWGVRTRRIQPFSSIGRFTRKVGDPLIAPVERRVIKAGGTSATAPWWTVVLVLLAGLVVLALVTFVRDTLASVFLATSQGTGGILRLLLSWTFGVLQVALLVRVITSWVGGTYSTIGRLAHRMTEWLVGPLRRVLPAFGQIDISPLVAWFLLSLVRSLVLRAF